MFINPGGDAAVLKGSFSGKAIKNNAISVVSLDELGRHPSRVRAFVHLDVDRPRHLIQPFARIVQMIPGRRIAHAADEKCPITFKSKFTAVKGMLRSLENPGAFISLGSSELTFFGIPREDKNR